MSENDTTSKDQANADVISRLAPSAPESRTPRGRPTTADMERVRRYNLAVWRLVNGKGNAVEEIAVLTGLTPVAIHRRSWRISQSLTDDELIGQAGTFTDSESKYLTLAYAGSKDPDVRRWLAEIRDVEKN